jgi:RNAse (barnase) inhibitor barstar
MLRAMNPFTNIVEIFWRPAVKGVGRSRYGGKNFDSLSDILQDGRIRYPLLIELELFP